MGHLLLLTMQSESLCHVMIHLHYDELSVSGSVKYRTVAIAAFFADISYKQNPFLCLTDDFLFCYI